MLFRSMRLAIAVASVVAVLAYAALSGLWVSNNSAWYFALAQPPWQPPNWVFGVIWPYNFVMLAVVSVQVALNRDMTVVWVWLSVLTISIATAILWSYFFYVQHQLGIAAACLSVTAAVTIVLTMITSSQQPQLWFFLPYQLWLITAASLSIGYWHLNRL